MSRPGHDLSPVRRVLFSQDLYGWTCPLGHLTVRFKSEGIPTACEAARLRGRDDEPCGATPLTPAELHRREDRW